MRSLILSLDQGTTSSGAMLFDRNGSVLFLAQQEFKQYYPEDGWVEHDAEEIWRTTLSVMHAVLAKAEAENYQVDAMGITNQRETTVLWHRKTGKPIHNAIVWQDRRTANYCDALRAARHEQKVTAKTGLLLDSYFSASKIHWLLQNVSNAAELAENGELALGTIDSFLLWRLTGG